MKNTYKYIIVLTTLIPLFFFFIYSFFLPSHLCQISDEFNNSSYKGVVIDKYFDQKNHRVKTVIVKTEVGNISLILPRDTSVFFDYIMLGDSVKKKQKEDYISVHRQKSVKKIRIYFGCD